jgi:hypothetical protein
MASIITGNKKKLFSPDTFCSECRVPLLNLKKIVCIGYKLFQKIKVLDKNGNINY